MAQRLFSYLTSSNASPPDPEKTALRALPSNWYSSPEMYELERRSIFSRKWMLITHKARLIQPGDWLNFDAAGYRFIIAKDRDGNINAFHNVCRHRAYPVVEADSGTAKIFQCKYHGWSYGLNGKLAKAPGYQELDGFDKLSNGLLPIHVHIDQLGFIWTNLDSSAKPEISWEQEFADVDQQARYGLYQMEDYVFDHTWEMEGGYNWKILADNYNECYHCATTHPDITALADLHSYSVNCKASRIVHNAATTDEQRKNGLTVASTYYFPNVSTNISPHFFMIQRFVPSGPKSSKMHYQVFRNKNSSDEDFELVNQIYKRIMSEDKVLCDRAQKNLNAGVFVNGELHPRLERGPLHFQNEVRQTVMAHHARERVATEEIWPARQKIPESAKMSRQDSAFCAGLSCSTVPEVLAW